jgi:hypothetical protein
MNYQFYKVQLQKIQIDGRVLKVLKIVNVTPSIRFFLITGETKVLQMVNACVSHEMRNPINSIFSMILKVQDHAEELLSLVNNEE